MKRHDLIRMLLCAGSYLLFLPLAYFLYNGRTGIYIDAYKYAFRPIDSMSVQQTVLFTIFIGLGGSILIILGLNFFTSDKKAEKRSILLNLPLSLAVCLPYLVSYALSLIFILLLSYGKAGIFPIAITYLLIWAIQILLIVLPSPKVTPIPKPISSIHADRDLFLRYSRYLRELSAKSDSPALREATDDLAGLLDTIDPALSDGVDALEAKLSAECIEIENAILGGSSVKLTLLTRELIDLAENIRTRIAAASLTVRGERFESTDNEIAEGLIDKILDEMNLDDEADIVNRDVPLDTDLRFVKALNFADSEYRAILEGYNTAIRQRLTDAQNAEKARQKKIRQTVQKITYACFGLLGIAVAAIFAIRAFVTQPGGICYTNTPGGLSVVGYNRMYGDTLEIPASSRGKDVVAVGKGAFEGQTGVAVVVVPEGVKTLDIYSFQHASVSEVYLPASLEHIYGFVFYETSSITVHYAGDEESWDEIYERSGNTKNGKNYFTLICDSPYTGQ